MNKRIKRRKGFTLIELLAVIVILAIIALIAIPNIIKILNKTRLSAAIDSAYGILSSAETYVANQMLLNKDSNISDLTFEANDGKVCANENDCLSFKGTKPSSGYVYILNNGSNFVLENLVINGFTCNKPIFEDEVTCEKTKSTEIIDENEGIICGDGNTEDYDNLTECYIKSIADYKEFTDLVNSGKSFSGKTVYLSKSLDLNEVTLEPIGNNNNKFEGTFEGNGNTLKNIKIESGNDYVGIFGYNIGTIRGVNFENISVKGNNYVGGIAGFNEGNISSIIFSGNVTGNENVGGITGQHNSGNNYYSPKPIENVIVKDIIVNGNKNVGGVTGYSYKGTIKVVVENGNINTGGCIYGANSYSSDGKSACSNSVQLDDVADSREYNGDRYDLSSDLLSSYEVYVDTIYGGDNNSDGYYFGYNNKMQITLMTTTKDPIEFNLKGSGTEEDPYQIRNVNDFNNAAINMNSERNSSVYSVMNDIDFSNKYVYQFGIYGNPFKGTFEGNGYTLKNIKIESGNDYVGIFGYNTGTIRGVNFENISVKGNNYVGGIAGFNEGNISSIIFSGNVTGNENVGGITGQHNSGNNYYSPKPIENVIVKDIIVNGNKNVGGVTGYSYKGTIKVVVENGNINTGGCIYGAHSYGSDGKSACSNSVQLDDVADSREYNGDRYDLSSDLLSSYEVYVDTIYGGDNNSDGYYFGYNNKMQITLMTTMKDPIEFNLKGSGTEEDPYQIRNVNDFNNAAINMNSERNSSVYSVMNDIDFSNKYVYQFGIYGNPFKGTFEGNGNTLKNIKIETTTDYVGIFGYNTGTIRGVNFENISVKGNNYVGGIAGFNEGNISSIIFSGNVTGNENVGGITGQHNSGNNYYSPKPIENVIVKDIIVNGNKNVGGVAGFAYNGTLKSVVENGSINKGGCIYANWTYGITGKSACSNSVQMDDVVDSREYNGDRYDLIENVDLNFYKTNFSTILNIGSDNTNNGYYFDYDSIKKVMIIKKV